jgi:hypothetical protein
LFINRGTKSNINIIQDISIQTLQTLTFDNSASRAFKIRVRLISEHKWIQKLQTPYPLGLNDNIYQESNIKKNPDYDVFQLLEIRKQNQGCMVLVGLMVTSNGNRVIVVPFITFTLI